MGGIAVRELMPRGDGWGGPGPWGMMEEFRRLFDQPFAFLQRALGDTPTVEVFEQGDDVVVRAEVPGVDPQDLDVRVTDRTVSLRGEIRRAAEEQRQGYYYGERRYGAFQRTVPLPVPVDADKAHARYQHGVLEIRIPRTGGPAGGRRLPVDIQ